MLVWSTNALKSEEPRLMTGRFRAHGSAEKVIQPGGHPGWVTIESGGGRAQMRNSNTGGE